MVKTAIRIVKIRSTKESMEVIVSNRPKNSRIRKHIINVERHDTLRKLVGRMFVTSRRRLRDLKVNFQPMDQ
jgi:hypothetical protein